MRRLLPIVCLAGLVLAARPGRADEMRDDFAWFGQLGFPDPKGLPFVKFTYGWFGDGKPGHWIPQWSVGFLQEKTSKISRILTLNFETREVITEGAISKHVDMGTTKNFIVPSSLRKYAESVLAPDPQHDPRNRLSWPGNPHFELRSNFFVLAWVCHQNGMDDLAARLYVEAKGVQTGLVDEQGRSFHQNLENEIATDQIWEILLDFGDPTITRPQLLAKLQAFRRAFPGTRYEPKARALADELEIMVAEDRVHPKLTAEEIAKLPPPEQAKEWIFRLRDQNGGQMSQPGGPDIFWGHDGGTKEKSPAEQLLALNDAAVPALIDALEDPHLTRTVGYGRDFRFSHDVMTVGAAARQVICRMTNRNLDDRGAIEAWWKERQEKGEEGEMAAAIARGDENSASTGFLFTQKFPDHALPPILAGIQAAKNPYVRSQLVALAERLKKDSVPQSLLLEKTAPGQPLANRVSAAYDLAKLGNLDAIPALAKKWARVKSQSEEDESDDDEDTRGALMALLATVDTPVGVQALGHGLGKCAPETRRDVLQALDLWGMSHREMTFTDPPLKPQRRPETLAAIEAVLGSELEDLAPMGFSGEENGIKLPADLRLGDYAAFLLSQHWPDRYQFKTTGSLPEREKQRLACLETWKGKRAQ